MNELTILLSEDEIGMIGNELNRLFLFQDRPMSNEKKSAFLEEIRGWGYPCGAIISGIRKLMSEDLKTLKLVTIKGAANEFIHRDETEKIDCSHCDKRGIVLMKDLDQYEYALACICSNGNRYRGPDGLATWNGQNLQTRGKKTLELRLAGVPF